MTSFPPVAARSRSLPLAAVRRRPLPLAAATGKGKGKGKGKGSVFTVLFLKNTYSLKVYNLKQQKNNFCGLLFELIF